MEGRGRGGHYFPFLRVCVGGHVSFFLSFFSRELEGTLGAADMGRAYEANTGFGGTSAAGGGDDDDFAPEDEEHAGAGGGGGGGAGGVAVFGEAGSRATRGTLEALRGGERIMEALELADAEIKALAEWEQVGTAHTHTQTRTRAHKHTHKHTRTPHTHAQSLSMWLLSPDVHGRDCLTPTSSLRPRVQRSWPPPLLGRPHQRSLAGSRQTRC
jgi:hypothetical protein